MSKRLPIVYALVILFEIAYLGWRYATDPPSSSSTLSIALGWAGLLSMVIMLVYTFARRSRRLKQLARLSTWLHFHIFAGVQGVVFVVFHSMHLFTREARVNLLNPAVINLIAVLVVFASGIFGRYLYGQLPRNEEGEILPGVAAVEKIFRRWIVLHRPIAAIMYVLSAVHVALSYMFTPSLGR
jgi:uncharacterized membrane protein HdeD (DUF308 family)